MISGKITRFPLEGAAKIAMTEVKTFWESHAPAAEIIFVCCHRQSYECYRSAVKEILLSNDKG